MPRHAHYTPQGVIPAVLLPFADDLAIDEKSLRKHLADVAAAEGLSAITVNAHSTEVASCSFDEQRRVLEIAQDEIGGRLPLVVLPHGGPHACDSEGFDFVAQFLASRGYGVLQPEFVGSLTCFFAKIRKDRNVPAYDRVQGRAQIADHAARPNNDSSHDSEVSDNSISGDLQTGCNHGPVETVRHLEQSS